VRKRVKSKSKHLGPVYFGPYDEAMERALRTAERAAEALEEYQRRVFGETAVERREREQKQKLNELHEKYGLKLGPSNPVPEEKPLPHAEANILSSQTDVLGDGEWPVR
jgi:hypothetical protein